MGWATHVHLLNQLRTCRMCRVSEGVWGLQMGLDTKRAEMAKLEERARQRAARPLRRCKHPRVQPCRVHSRVWPDHAQIMALKQAGDAASESKTVTLRQRCMHCSVDTFWGNASCIHLRNTLNVCGGPLSGY